MSDDRRRDERRAGADRRSEDRRNAFAPGRRINDAWDEQTGSPCRGVCALSDTGMCDGCAHTGCEAALSGLCARREILTSNRAQMASVGFVRPVFGADSYAVAAAAFLARLDEDPGFDDIFYAKLLREQRKSTKYALEVETQIGVSPLPTPTMSDVLTCLLTPKPSPSLFATQIFMYAFRNHRCAIEINHIEDRFAVTATAANSAMRKLFNASYASVLSVIRTEHAKRYLALSGIRINEAGNLAGFESVNNFSVSFKRIVGLSPKEYRATKTILI